MLCLFFIFLLVDTCFAAQNIKIEIPEVIYMKENNFTLGNAAKISGGTGRIRRELSGLKLYSDGNFLTRNEVLRAIEESDASDARIELYMPFQVRIEKPGFEGNFTESESLNSERSASSLAPIIKTLAAWDGDVTVTASSSVPSGKLIDPASIVPGTPAATLRFRDENGRVRSLGVRLTWTQNVFIAARNIFKGDRINRQDIFLRPMKITKPGFYASNPDEIVGFVADRNIKQGEPVMLGVLTNSSVIKKGRRVKIIARYGGAMAVTEGILLEDGSPGEFVRVRRSDNKKIVLMAQIINENSVEVEVN